MEAKRSVLGVYTKKIMLLLVCLINYIEKLKSKVKNTVELDSDNHLCNYNCLSHTTDASNALYKLKLIAEINYWLFFVSCSSLSIVLSYLKTLCITRYIIGNTDSNLEIK